MSVPENFKALAGTWEGKNTVWLTPKDPGTESDTGLVVTPKANGRFLSFDYTWSYENSLEEGVILVGCHPRTPDAKAVWIDSWHNADSMMRMDGKVDYDGFLSIYGTYLAPPGPDWGWRIVIEPPKNDRFKITMFNIDPHHNEEVAVEAVYHRKKA